ncbi:MAG: hypothetical protein M0R03_08745 [Novosphingobium sp.]|nr:hypothetical protein [Novosphingobium sp.]
MSLVISRSYEQIIQAIKEEGIRNVRTIIFLRALEKLNDFQIATLTDWMIDYSHSLSNDQIKDVINKMVEYGGHLVNNLGGWDIWNKEKCLIQL